MEIKEKFLKIWQKTMEVAAKSCLWDYYLAKLFRQRCLILMFLLWFMVSENETLGLVYLEVMAQGCIPVGSRGEAIDGIIVDGRNGFLVNPNNEEDLCLVILKINKMDKEKKGESIAKRIRYGKKR